MCYRLVPFLLLLSLGACDRLYGVESRATLHREVNVFCVNATLHDMPETGQILYQRNQYHSTEMLPKQREVQIITHHWLYGEGQGDILEIIQTTDGWEYTNSRRRMGVPVAHEEMRRFLPVMQKINRALQMRCGLPVGGLRGEAVGSTKSQEI
jgi:hypothetical protein